ncbi:hypothetical protein CEXT_49211 [Caerostris extrusa]|uniref:Uncharacterized protein n=1 Tax=Caerostris extrusa TaxID=172846 RepID=A0AAV4XR28_CAEEX|nr:hypothetical protein CEXT_49211 [Caerostris extrusa]
MSIPLLQSGSAQDSPTNPNELPTRSPLLAPRLHSKHVFLASRRTIRLSYQNRGRVKNSRSTFSHSYIDFRPLTLFVKHSAYA